MPSPGMEIQGSAVGSCQDSQHQGGTLTVAPPKFPINPRSCDPAPSVPAPLGLSHGIFQILLLLGRAGTLSHLLRVSPTRVTSPGDSESPEQGFPAALWGPTCSIPSPFPAHSRGNSSPELQQGADVCLGGQHGAVASSATKLTQGFF